MYMKRILFAENTFTGYDSWSCEITHVHPPVCCSNIIHADKTSRATVFRNHFLQIWQHILNLFWHHHLALLILEPTTIKSELLCTRDTKDKHFALWLFCFGCCYCCLCYPYYIIYKHILTNLSKTKFQLPTFNFQLNLLWVSVFEWKMRFQL